MAGKITYSKYSDFFEKKRRMRILSARIFSKSFGGKIKHGQTDVNKETTFKQTIDMTLASKISFLLYNKFLPKVLISPNFTLNLILK